MGEAKKMQHRVKHKVLAVQIQKCYEDFPTHTLYKLLFWPCQVKVPRPAPRIPTERLAKHLEAFLAEQET